MLKRKITTSVNQNYWLKSLDTNSLDQPTRFNKTIKKIQAIK